MPEGAEEGIVKGMYLFRAGEGKGPRVQLLGSGTILREVIAAAELLASDWGVVADIWSVPSFTELRREAIEVERWNLLHPTATPRRSHVETCLERQRGAGGRGDGLHAAPRRPDPPLRAAALPGAGHRRLRPVRLPPPAPPTSSRWTGTG